MNFFIKFWSTFIYYLKVLASFWSLGDLLKCNSQNDFWGDKLHLTLFIFNIYETVSFNLYKSLKRYLEVFGSNLVQFTFNL